jgi:hypothetical protein
MFNMITPAVPQLGYVWDTSSLTVNGTLKLKPLVVTSPTISNVSVTGTNLTFGGTGGAPFYTYNVLATADLTQPLVAWSQIGTGTFAADGTFVLNLGIDPVTFPQLFYTIQFVAP